MPTRIPPSLPTVALRITTPTYVAAAVAIPTIPCGSAVDATHAGHATSAMIMNAAPDLQPHGLARFGERDTTACATARF